MAYTIQPGDNLWTIWSNTKDDTGLSWSDFQALNTHLFDDAHNNGSLVHPNEIVYLSADESPATETPDEPPDEPPDETPPADKVTADDTGGTDQPPVTVGSATIPDGARLIVINNPEGFDGEQLYLLAYNWRGITVTYEIGDHDRFVELFGSRDGFDTVNVMSQQDFDDLETTVSGGDVDEILNSEESIGSQIEREVRALGLEDLPSWIADDTSALALIATATGEDWSSGRLWKELSQLGSFQKRFASLDVFLQEGITIAEAVGQYIAAESSLRSALSRFRPGQEFSTEYLSELIAGGWDGDTASDVLETEAYLARNPDALAQANLVLVASGFEAVDETGLANIMRGAAPPDVIEALNTAAAAQAIAAAGIELDDETIGLLIDVVDDFSTIRTGDDFAQVATDLALNLIRNRRDLDFDRYGLSREDLFAAAFGEESPSGKGVGETVSLLARLERERKEATGGFDNFGAFIDQDNNLRIQGLGNI